MFGEIVRLARFLVKHVCVCVGEIVCLTTFLLKRVCVCVCVCLARLCVWGWASGLEQPFICIHLAARGFELPFSPTPLFDAPDNALALQTELAIRQLYFGCSLSNNSRRYGDSLWTLSRVRMVRWSRWTGRSPLLGVSFVRKSNGSLRLIFDTCVANTHLLDPPGTMPRPVRCPPRQGRSPVLNQTVVPSTSPLAMMYSLLWSGYTRCFISMVFFGADQSQ